MKAVYKEPGKAPEIIDAGNSLEALQFLVQGYIETVTLLADVVLICNEEGWLRGMPYNCRLSNLTLVGPILLVGRDGDEFCDCPMPEWWADQLQWEGGQTHG